MRIVTIVALVAAGVLGVLLTVEVKRRTATEAELARVRESVREGEPRGAPPMEEDLVGRVQPPAPAPPARDARPVTAPVPAEGASGEATRLLEERGQQLAEASKAREELEGQVRQLEERIQSLTAETEKVASAEKRLREQVEAAGRQVASLEGELKARDERLQKAELSIRELRQRGEDNAGRSAKLAKVSEDFEDLNRRRDSYMTNVLRRYREVTDLYRTMTLRPESAHTDVSQIQNAISLAEEDLRQLQSLNAQARRLQKDLDAARK